MVFIYGTLLSDDLRRVVLGRDVAATPAVLDGYVRKAVAGRLFPALEPLAGGRTDGMILQDLTPQDVQALDFYLDAALFARASVTASINGARVPVETHLPKDPRLLLKGDWSLADHQALALQVARHVMRSFDNQSPLNTPLFHHGLDMRAQASLRAQAHPAPVKLRHGFSAADVEVIRRQQPYSKYFAVEEITLRHKLYDGSMSEPVERAVFLAADAVTILPYDPQTDRLLIVEQFRPATFIRDDQYPWVLEPVAGRCDADEPIEDTARREVMEEAGLTVKALEKIGSYYTTPGGVTEYIFSFVGIVDLADAGSEIHGLASEGENIRTHVLPFETAMEVMQSGEVECGPLLVSLLWLQSNRTRLRSRWLRA